MRFFYINNGKPPRRSLSERLQAWSAGADDVVVLLLVLSAFVVFAVTLAVLVPIWLA